MNFNLFSQIKKERMARLALVGLLMLSACGIAKRLPQRSTTKPMEAVSNDKTPSAVHSSTYNKIQASLWQAYDDWKHTPYEWGGTTLQGVDCSAFMQILFNRYLGVDLPRTTHQQIYVGTTVKRDHLKPGDLVFFKTGRKSLHVGVIIKNKKFLHASTSQGVTISSLTNYYWRSRFLTAKRVL